MIKSKTSFHIYKNVAYSWISLDAKISLIFLTNTKQSRLPSPKQLPCSLTSPFCYKSFFYQLTKTNTSVIFWVLHYPVISSRFPNSWSLIWSRLPQLSQPLPFFLKILSMSHLKYSRNRLTGSFSQLPYSFPFPSLYPHHFRCCSAVTLLSTYPNTAQSYNH